MDENPIQGYLGFQNILSNGIVAHKDSSRFFSDLSASNVSICHSGLHDEHLQSLCSKQFTDRDKLRSLRYVQQA